MLLEKKNRKFANFPSFQFCPIPKIENYKISKSTLLLKILKVVVTENAKRQKVN